MRKSSPSALQQCLCIQHQTQRGWQYNWFVAHHLFHDLCLNRYSIPQLYPHSWTISTCLLYTGSFSYIWQWLSKCWPPRLGSRKVPWDCKKRENTQGGPGESNSCRREWPYSVNELQLVSYVSTVSAVFTYTHWHVKATQGTLTMSNPLPTALLHPPWKPQLTSTLLG